MKRSHLIIIMCVVLMCLCLQSGCFASGIVSKKDFTISPREGHYRYPETIVVRAWKEYQVDKQTRDSYVIRYELDRGIFLLVHVPKDQVEYIKETQKEAREREQRQRQRDYEKAQKAKGFVRAGSFWASPKNKKLWNDGESLKKLRRTLMQLKERKESSEAMLLQLYEDTTKQTKRLVSLQEQVQELGQWLEERKVRISKRGTRTQVRTYNAKILEYNKLNSHMSEIVLRIKKQQARYEKMEKSDRRINESYEKRKTDYLRRFSRVEGRVLDALSRTDEQQKEILEHLAKHLRLFRSELMHSVIALHRYREGAFVKGTVNGDLHVLFMIDTGASFVTISRKMAKALGLKINKKTARKKMKLANGAIESVPVLKLDSVAIGGVRRSTVEAAVLNDSPHFTALLGMSFLKHFSWHFEGKDRIVFETFETK